MQQLSLKTHHINGFDNSLNRHLMFDPLKYLLFFAFPFVPATRAQNLIRNGSFETHQALDCLPCHLGPANFAATMNHWQSLNTGSPFICDCRYKKNADEVKNRWCRFEQVSPQDGCSMMELEYMPARLDFNHETRGNGTYLATQLSAPLEIGKVYEISFWLHILAPETPDYARQIGITLYPDAVRNPTGKLLEGSAFLIDTVVYGTWYRVNWHVRPLCSLRYLAIGVFRGADGPPVNFTSQRNVFYVDAVSVTPVAEHQPESAGAIPFCRLKQTSPEDLPETVVGTTSWFAFSDSLLTPASKSALDSFANRAKRQPYSAFFATGHTDSIGTNHRQLSSARIENVLAYLEKEHRISRLRFIVLPYGSSRPLASNATETGRQQNRRVEIRPAECPVAATAYRNLLLQVFNGENERAFKTLQAWLALAEDGHKLYMLYDPRLTPLKTDPQWLSVQKRVKDGYKKFKQKDKAFALDCLWAEDQKLRTLQFYIENLGAWWPEIDSTEQRWDVFFPEKSDSLCAIEDREHFDALVKLIGQQDWPEISEVGERAAKAAFLIVNHTMDTLVLARYLPVLQKKCATGEAEWLFYATMYDRLMTCRGLPQRYGTQFRVVDESKNQYELFPLEDPVGVNQRRKALGLGALAGFD